MSPIPPTQDALLESYLSRVMAVAEERRQQLSPDEIQQIARELGMSEADLAAAAEEGARHLVRGQGFARHRRWDDAIAELGAAVALQPENKEALLQLAQAYRERHALGGAAADRQEAERLARRCLDLDPRCEEAFVLLDALDRPRAAAPARSEAVPRSLLPVSRPEPATPAVSPPAERTGVPAVPGPARVPPRKGPTPVLVILIVLGLAAVPVLGIIGVAFFLFAVQEPPQVVPVAMPPAQVVSGSGSTAVVEQTEPEPPADAEIPVSWDESPAAAGLRFEAYSSHLDNYPQNSFYKMQALIHNESKEELKELKLKLELLDEQGKVLATENVEALADHQAALRPGDQGPFSVLKQITPELVRCRLTVLTAQRLPAAKRYGTPRPVPVQWGFERPEHLQLEVGEREVHQSKPFYSLPGHHQAVIEVRNTGEGAYTLLKMEAAYLDRREHVLFTREFYVVSTSDPPLLPGRAYVDRMIHEAAPDLASYRLTVIEAR